MVRNIYIYFPSPDKGVVSGCCEVSRWVVVGGWWLVSGGVMVVDVGIRESGRYMGYCVTAEAIL